MKLIVGLGNPEAKYAQNRHNVGFMALDYFVAANKWPEFKEESKFQAAITEHKDGVAKTILAKPLTFMNSSGEAVSAVAKFYKVAHKDIVVIYDELAIEFGTVRTRDEGSSAGHNGVESIIKTMGKGFTRVRIGIANEHAKKSDATSFVLSDFGKDEAEQLPHIFDYTNQLIHEFITLGKLAAHTEKIL